MQFEFHITLDLKDRSAIPNKFESNSLTNAKRIVRRIINQHPELSKMEFSKWGSLLGIRFSGSLEDKPDTLCCLRYLKSGGWHVMSLRWQQNYEEVR